MKASKRLQNNFLSYDIFNQALNKTVTGPKKKSSIFLHGILGSKRNWRTPATVFKKLHPDFDCVTVDFRGHGESNPTHRSPYLWEDNTVDSCSHDLSKLIDSKLDEISVAPNIIVAHSFGGKVALKFLERLYVEV